MKFKKIDLLTLLIGLFLFASCENTSTIGLNVDPSIAIKGTLVDTISISSRTIAEEATATTNATRHPLGYLSDPLFGTTEASLAMVVNLPVDAYNFGTTPTLDSAILVLNYGGEFYGDSTANYTINVRQLNLNLSRETSFLSTKDWSLYTNSTILGSKTGKIYPNTKFKVSDIVTGKPDTLKTVTPQIRISLNKTFIENNIININADNLKYNANFNRFLGGLHIDVSGVTGRGGLMFFNFSSENTGLMLYYKKQNPPTSKPDTIAINFPIAKGTNPVAATIKHNYTGTPIATQLSNPTVQYPVTYLQPLTGLRNKISFPHLTKFASNVGKVAVNKAELIIDLSSGTDVAPFEAAPRLALYRYDIAERRTNVPDNNRGTSQYDPGDRRALTQAVFGGYFNSLTKQYVFVVTSYVQDLLDGKTKDYGTFLAATPSKEFEFFPSISTGARAVIGSFKKNPAAGDNIMKLNVYFTKIN